MYPKLLLVLLTSLTLIRCQGPTNTPLAKPAGPKPVAANPVVPAPTAANPIGANPTEAKPAEAAAREVESDPNWRPPLVETGTPPEVRDQTLSAQQLNELGHRYYEAKAWPQAIAVFEEAVKRDPKNALAWYNLACTMGLARRQYGGACGEVEVYMDSMLRALEQAATLDASRRKQMKTDSDLDEIRDTIWYQVLDGGILQVPIDLQRMVVKAGFTDVGQGAHGHIWELDFKEDGSWEATMSTGGIYATTGDAPQPGQRRPTRKGKWKALDGARIEFSEGSQTQVLTIDKQGNIRQEGQTSGIPMWIDIPEECSA